MTENNNTTNNEAHASKLKSEEFNTLLSLKMCNFANITQHHAPKQYPVNIHELKEMSKVGGILEDAHIFKYLFGIETPEHFKKKEEGLDFSLYNIYFDEWNDLLIFLRFGKSQTINRRPEKILLTCNKLGGIPAYDRWYKNIYQIRKQKENEMYNPMSPYEDTKKLYIWKSCSPNDVETFGANNKEYSITSPCKVSQFISVMYWRKPIESKK
tara:strand:+ start:1003 stop:1638 length:636 start_codon:yes stop_codon:yes gene_type:complete